MPINQLKSVFPYLFIFAFLFLFQNTIRAQLSKSERAKIKYFLRSDSSLIKATHNTADSLIEDYLEKRDSVLNTKSLFWLDAYVGNHFNTNGRVYGTRQFAYGSVAGYTHKSGLSLYVGEESWSSQGAKPEFYYPGINYSLDIFNWLNINASLEHWYFLKTDKFSKSILNNNFEPAINFYFQNFSQTVTYHLIWNQIKAEQFESKTSYIFQKYAFMRFDRIEFNPELVIAWGTPNSIWQGFRKAKPTKKLTAPVISDYNANGIYHLSTQFGLPVSVYRKWYSLTLAYYHTIPYTPMNGEKLRPLNWFQFTYSAYLFPKNKKMSDKTSTR